MPIRPAAWFAAIVFLLLLIADIIFGIVSASWGETWTLWGPILAIIGSWVIAFIGGIFSIFILRIVKFFSIFYLLGFIVLGIWAIAQGQWGILGIAVGGAIVTMFVGGLMITLEQAVMRASMGQWLPEAAGN